jgi:histidine triad (HIT) family protein
MTQNGGTNCEFGHFHFHVFPRFTNDGYGWIYPEGEKEVSAEVAARIRAAM